MSLSFKYAQQLRAGDIKLYIIFCENDYCLKNMFYWVFHEKNATFLSFLRI